MAETCIVCLGDLAGTEAHQYRSPGSSNLATAEFPATTLPEPRSLRCKSVLSVLADHDQNETIAHLLPCGHDLHNECLKPWVERANSCPICRQSFNEVELRANIYGPCLTSYAVQDKRQVAEIDATMIVDDDVLEDSSSDPCIICERHDDHNLLGCDGCNGSYHLLCAGLEYVPTESWFCQFCHEDGTAQTDSRPRAGRSRPGPRRRRAIARRNRSPDAWARVWQSVLDNLNIDLDFPFDEEEQEVVTQATRAQRRDFKEWERRFMVAERQGGAARFRDTAATIFQSHHSRSRGPTPNPESQEELRAWNAFDKARELNSSAASVSTRRNKRKSPTASPAEPPLQVERMLKRPRTRRAQDLSDRAAIGHAETFSAAYGEESHRAVSPAAPSSLTESDSRSFFSALLNEVATSPSTPDGAASRDPLISAATAPLDSVSSPASSTPVSPAPSASSWPRSRESSPTRYNLPRPASPPLTSTIAPVPQRHHLAQTSTRSISSASNANLASGVPAILSKVITGGADDNLRSPKTTSDYGGPTLLSTALLFNYSHVSSPPRDAGYHNPLQDQSTLRSTKTEIQSMVAAALKPVYQKRDIDKDQYTDINRDISRKLYDKVGDAGGLSNDDTREVWRSVAEEEVRLAVERLRRPAEVDTAA